MKRFSNILLVVDECTDYSAALRRGTTLARMNQARLTVCAIVDTVPGEVRMGAIRITRRQVLDIATARRREWLEDTVNSAADDEVAIDKKVLVGIPFIEIIRQVLRDEHDLIIKCADAGSGLRTMLFSSTDQHLMRKCPCPVWIIKPTERQKYLRILAAVDQDPEEPVKDALNRQILEMSTSMALMEYSEAHIVHAWEVFDESLLTSHKWDFSEAEFEQMLKEEAAARRRWLETLVENYGTSIQTNSADVLDLHLHVVKGPAQFVVSELARELAVDLVVMGTVARTGIDGFFMGNTAESILAQLDCSVLTVKPPGFTSPVTLEG
ncbi:MAG: universal stress protein [Gammaproteobacteria bacterium]|nr:universal stress protein [Gammaproteobacteria bacterium]